MSIVTLTDELPAILGSIRALESEHGPDNWPAVQMRDLTAMRDEIAHLRVALEHAWGELDDLKAQPQPKAVPPTAPLPEPDFTLDGDTTACYYAETVTRLLAASQPQPESVRELTVVEIMRLWADAKDSIVDFARAVLAAKGTK